MLESLELLYDLFTQMPPACTGRMDWFHHHQACCTHIVYTLYLRYMYNLCTLYVHATNEFDYVPM